MDLAHGTGSHRTSARSRSGSGRTSGRSRSGSGRSPGAPAPGVAAVRALPLREWPHVRAPAPGVVAVRALPLREWPHVRAPPLPEWPQVRAPAPGVAARLIQRSERIRTPTVTLRFEETLRLRRALLAATLRAISNLEIVVCFADGW